MHTEPNPQDADALEQVQLEEEDLGDAELDRDDTHGMPDTVLDDEPTES
jgi:hypothetical protein